MQTKEFFPDVFRLESCGSCNFQCRHCPNGYTDTVSKRGVMPQNLFNHILMQWEERNFIPRVVVLYHGGEPLLNNNIAKNIRKLKSIGVQITKITSNCSLMTPELACELTEAGLDTIDASFDGSSAAENNTIRRNGNFERDANNLITLLKINKDIEIRISNVQIMSKKEIMAFLDGKIIVPPKFLTEKFSAFPNVSFITVPAMTWPMAHHDAPHEIIKIKQKEMSFCSNFEETINILANGDVVPCCYDIMGKKVFGNVYEQSIFSIRDNTATQQFRQEIATHQYPAICQSCFRLTQTYLVKN